MAVVKHKNLFAKVEQCPGCVLKKHTRNQLVGRGSAPAKLLFIGEGPNKTEDLLNENLVGPAWDLLELMIEGASAMVSIEIPTFYLSNIVLCRPWIWDYSDPDCGFNREPTKQEVLACMPNIIEIARVVNPLYVVFIGRVAESFYKREFTGSTRITHPSAHVRYGGKASPTYMQDVRTLSVLFKKLEVKK